MLLKMILLTSLFINSAWALDLNKIHTYKPIAMRAFSLSKSAIAKEQDRLSGGNSRYLINFENEVINSHSIVLASVLQQRPITAKRVGKALYEFTEISKLFDHVYLSTKVTILPSRDSYLYRIPLKGIYSPGEEQAFVLNKKKNYELLAVKIVEIQNDSAVISAKVQLDSIAISHLSYLPTEIKNKEDAQ